MNKLSRSALSVSAVCIGLLTITQTSIPAQGQETGPPTLHIGDGTYYTGTSPIEVRFPTTMVAPELLGKEALAAPVVLSPSLDGTFTWRSQRSGTFAPAGALPLSTDFSVSTTPGLRDLEGNVVPQTIIGTISTERARATSQFPRYFPRHDLPRQLEVFYFFNAEVDLESARKSIRFADDAGVIVLAKVRHVTGAELPNEKLPIGTREQQFKGIRPEVQADTLIKSALAITPALPLPEGDNWKVAWEPLTTEGGRLTESESGRVLGNVPAFLVTDNTFVSRYDAQDYLEISLNKPLGPNMTAEKLHRWVTVHPEPENMAIRVSDRSFRINGDFGLRSYSVDVAPGLPSADGSLLKQRATKIHEVKAMPPHLSVPAFGATQYGQGKKTFEIIAANLSHIRVRVKQVDPRDAARALAAYDLYKTNPDRKDKDALERVPFQIVPGRTVYDETYPSGVGLDQSDKFILNWEELLGKEISSALLFVSVEGTLKPQVDLEGSLENGTMIAQSLLQITDIGLAWKRTKVDALVYAFSQHTGQPLPGVVLHRYDNDASAIGTSMQTDAMGMARVPLEQAKWLVAQRGEDVQAIRYGDDLPQVSMWQFGVPLEWRNLENQYRETQIFTERPLYQPEEPVYLKCLTRMVQGTRITLPENREATLKLYDPEGKLFLTRDVVFTERGSFTDTIDLPDKASGLGTYRIEVTFDDWDGLLINGERRQTSRTFDHYIYVQEYKANTFSVELTSDDETIDAAAHTFPMSARYLMGKPLSKAKVTWSATVEDTAFWSNKWDGFRFGDARSDWVYAGGSYRDFEAVSNRVRSHSLSGNTELDDAGTATVMVPVAKQLEFPSRRTLSVTASITDINQQTISASNEKLVESSEFYLGLRPEESVVRVGETNAIELVAVTPGEAAYSKAVETELRIEKLLWNSVKIEGAGGAITTRNFLSIAEVDSRTITLQPDTMGTVPINPDAPGTYVVTARSADAAGRPVVSAMTITAYGAGDTYWHQSDGIRIDLQADKDAYLPGEQAMVVVKSAVHGPALITVERDTVKRQFITEITSDAQAIPIALNAQDTPNVFVSVLLVRGGADSGKKFPQPEFRLGYCELQVTNTTDGLQVEVVTDAETYRPGTTVIANATVKDVAGNPVSNAEVTLYAVDQGVLDLMHYDLPDPFRHFHQPQRLAVTAGSSLSGLLAENPDDRDFGNKGVIIGGGGLMALPNGQMRKNFKACAFWSGDLITGEDGRVAAAFKAPDNLTEYHLFAVAAEGANRFGGGEARLQVNKPIMLEPSLPRFANVGDHIVAKGVIHNTSKHGGEFLVSLKIDETADHSEAELEPVRTRTVTLAPGESAAVAFPIAMKAIGEAVWNWSVAPINSDDPALEELVDGVESRFPVSWPVPELHESHYKVVSDGAPANDLLSDVNPELLEGDGTIEITVSTSPLINAQGAIEQVLHYPYGCVEQTTSSTLPWIGLKDLRGALPSLNKSESEITDAITSGCRRMLSMQTKNGGLGYWPGAEEPMLWGSAYGGMALALAKESGIPLPEERLDQLCVYLSSQLRDSATEAETWDLDNRCLAAYTLALFGKAEPAYHAILGKKAEALSPAGRAYLALAILRADGSKAEAKALLELTTPEDELRRFYYPSSAAAMIAWCRLDPSSKQLASALRSLIGKRSLRGDWSNTYLNGWSLLALGEFTRASRATHGNLSIEATYQGVTRPLRLDDRNLLSAQAAFTFNRGDSLDKLRLKMPPGTQLYTIVDVTAQPRITPQQARSSGDFLIARTYEELSPDGTRTPPTDLEIGDLVLVTLEGQVTPRSEFIVVDDALPSILEAINPAFKSRESTTTVPPGSFRWYSNHQELRTERTLYFRDYIWDGGKFAIQYLARVIAEGTVTAPPAKIEAMYDPGKFGLSSSTVLTSTTSN